MAEHTTAEQGPALRFVAGRHLDHLWELEWMLRGPVDLGGAAQVADPAEAAWQVLAVSAGVPDLLLRRKSRSLSWAGCVHRAQPPLSLTSMALTVAQALEGLPITAQPIPLAKADSVAAGRATHDPETLGAQADSAEAAGQGRMLAPSLVALVDLAEAAGPQARAAALAGLVVLRRFC